MEWLVEGGEVGGMMADSYLIKRIKKIERLARKATIEDRRYERNTYGYAAGMIDHLHEVVHEYTIKIYEIEKADKEEEEREDLCYAKPSSANAGNADLKMQTQLEPVPSVKPISIAPRMRSRVIRGAILTADLFLLAISMGGVR